MNADLRAVAAPAFCKTTTHWAEGPAIDESRLATLVLSAPDPGALARVAAVAIGPYRVRLDHGKNAAHHEGRHADPLFALSHEGRPALELYVYDPEVLRGRDRVDAVLGDGTRLAVPLHRPAADGPRRLATSLALEAGGRLRLSVDAPDGAELVLQRVRWGRFVEERRALPAGRHEIDLPPAFADWHGVSVSTRSVLGDLESKHMLCGHLGGGSGRWLLDAASGALFAPRTSPLFARRALVIDARSAEALRAARERIAGFDEAEILVPAALDPAACAEAVAGLPTPARLTRWAEAGEPEADAADLLVVPRGPLPVGRPVSRLLFADSGAPGHAERCAAALAECEDLDEAVLLLDRAWLKASLAGEPPDGLPCHGVAFSRPSAAAAPADILRARVRESRRTLLSPGPCGACPEPRRNACLACGPFPGAGGDGAPLLLRGASCVLDGRAPS